MLRLWAIGVKGEAGRVRKCELVKGSDVRGLTEEEANDLLQLRNGVLGPHERPLRRSIANVLQEQIQAMEDTALPTDPLEDGMDDSGGSDHVGRVVRVDAADVLRISWVEVHCQHWSSEGIRWIEPLERMGP